MKNLKVKYKITLSVIALLLVVSVTTLFSYAYIGTIDASGVTNVSTSVNETTISDINVAYLTEPLTLYIDPDLLGSYEASNEYDSFIDSFTEVRMGITYPGDKYSDVYCYYDIIYTPTVVYNPTPGIGSLHELTIFGENYNDSITLDETVLDNVSEPVTLASDVEFHATSSGDTVNWDFYMRFYNLDVNQESSLSQTPSGTLSILTKYCRGEQ